MNNLEKLVDIINNREGHTSITEEWMQCVLMNSYTKDFIRRNSLIGFPFTSVDNICIGECYFNAFLPVIKAHINEYLTPLWVSRFAEVKDGMLVVKTTYQNGNNIITYHDENLRMHLEVNELKNEENREFNRDDNGKLLSVSVDNVVTHVYTYNDDGTLKTDTEQNVDDDWSVTTTFEYDDMGNVKLMSFDNGDHDIIFRYIHGDGYMIVIQSYVRKEPNIFNISIISKDNEKLGIYQKIQLDSYQKVLKLDADDDIDMNLGILSPDAAHNYIVNGYSHVKVVDGEVMKAVITNDGEVGNFIVIVPKLIE